MHHDIMYPSKTLISEMQIHKIPLKHVNEKSVMPPQSTQNSMLIHDRRRADHDIQIPSGEISKTLIQPTFNKSWS